MRTLFWSNLYRYGALLSFLFATPVLAATPVVITSTSGVHSAICNVFMWMFWILMSVSVIMIMWAAYLFVTAKDDAEQVSEAKKAIFYAAMGIVAALLANGFPVLIASIFSVSGVQGC
jgi:hypothetical protein